MTFLSVWSRYGVAFLAFTASAIPLDPVQDRSLVPVIATGDELPNAICELPEDLFE